MPNWFRSFMLLPWPLSKWVIACSVGIATLEIQGSVSAMGGTVALTSVGLFGEGPQRLGDNSHAPPAWPGGGGHCLEAGSGGGTDRAT